MNQKRKKTIKMAPQTAELLTRCIAVLRPPPTLTLSQWADKYRMLSAESSAEPGRWHTDKAPYQREIMDAISDPHIQKVVVMTAAQIGKTAMLLNMLGYYMHYYPAPIMVMQPTLDMGQKFSKNFLAPMLRDTPVLREMVDTKSRYAGNTILKKNFPGGYIVIVGANSPASLASLPIKAVLADEVDRYPPSAGTEGDPLSLAQKRQTTFWDKKTVIVSTPTIKGRSRIETEYNESTQEEWNVPCPHCGHYQPLVWGGIVYDKSNLKDVQYKCERCGCLAGEYEWKAQGRHGKFVAKNPEATVRGFHLNTLASTFCGWEDVVQKFILAHERLAQGDLEMMKTWINTELGETWEEPGDRVESAELLSRREIYEAEVPDGVLVLTAGVDVQDDRFEVEIVGWGKGKENWGIRYQKIYGDMLKEQVWDDLDNFLLGTAWHKADGTALHLLACCIDSGGHHPDQVYRFANARLDRRIFAIKGQGGAEVPYIRNPTRNNRVKVPLFLIGVDTGKATVYQRLKVKAKGPNYCHFPLNEEAGYDEEYFKGLTAEQRVTRYHKGRETVTWELKEGVKRNEPLDMRNYATAALEIANPVLKEPETAAAAHRPAGRRMISRGI